MRSSETALEAARKKLRILGFTDEAISAFQGKSTIKPEITIFSPISGTLGSAHLRRGHAPSRLRAAPNS
jgi:membrane fusion protein, heavy metal efflux system